VGEKRDLYRSYGQKLISLFVRLMFSGESYSLTELSSLLDCSKQTVLRLLGDITRAYGVTVEEEFRERRKYVRIKPPPRPLNPAPITDMEMQVLQMCRDFTSHLLGKPLFEEATRALSKSHALLEGDKTASAGHFASFRPGCIDYTPYYGLICTIIEAMERRKICRLVYLPIMAEKPRTYYLKPLKLFSHQDTVYLHAQKAREPGKPYRKAKYDPLFAVHRMKNAEITERSFDFPADYDFEKTFNRNFGIIKEKAFDVEIEFTGWSARYVSERIWSPDQKIGKRGKDRITLEFSASSAAELVSWVLSFGSEAKLIRPEAIRDELKRKILAMGGNYGP